MQAEGTIDGQTFYFRSRGEHWSLSIGGADVVGEPNWHYEEPCGPWPHAGWITEDEARAFIELGARLWRERASRDACAQDYTEPR